MAMKLNAGEVGRQDLFTIDPTEVLVDESVNGRWHAHTEAEVAVMAHSFEDDGGQLQPVQVRRIADKRVQLILGYRRHKAALLYNILHPDNPMKLLCMAVIVNDEEALKRNITENKERAETTPVDDAFNQRRLRDNHGWTDTKIAEYYHCKPSYVGVLKNLLALPNETLELIHDGKLSVQAGIALTDVSGEQQKAIMTTEPGLAPVLPTSQEVIAKVREVKVAAGGKQARSLREVRAFLEGLTGPAEAEAVRTFAETFVKFIQGTYTDKTMEAKIKAILAPVALAA